MKTNKESNVIPGDALFIPFSFFLLEQPATPELAFYLVFLSSKPPYAPLFSACPLLLLASQTSNYLPRLPKNLTVDTEYTSSPLL